MMVAPRMLPVMLPMPPRIIMATPMNTALNENWPGVRMRRRWPSRPPAMPGEEGGDGEADQARARHMHAGHLRRDIVVAHGAQGAAEARMHETVHDIDRQHEEAGDPPEIGQAGDAGEPERAAGEVDQIDDDDLHDHGQAERRHREIVAAQPQHGPADEDRHQRGGHAADQQRRQERHLQLPAASRDSRGCAIAFIATG